MKEKFSFPKRNVIVIIVIVLIAFGLRTYKHGDLLSFQLDQSRDAIIVSDFIKNGFSNIPLLGPHISGSSLQLGPIYYYILAIPAFLFGLSPQSFALPELFFSILFVPLLYLFLRLYFSKYISLSVSAIAAVSLFLIIYGRFAWNPNSLPFFTLLTAYGLLKSDWKNKIRPGWFYISILGVGIGTQLHYVYFFMAPAMLAVYLAVWRPRLKFKNYLFAFFIIFILYFPEIISEIRTEGGNTKLLFQNMFERVPSEEDDHGIMDKSFYAFQKMEIINWHMITSDEHGSSMKLSKKNLPVCKKKCREQFPYYIVQTVAFFLSIIASIYFYRRENDRDSKKFIFLVWLWMGLMFLVSIPIIYKMSPYYYLPIAAPIFVFLGLSLKLIEKVFGKNGKALVVLIAGTIIVWAIRNDIIFLKQHADLANENVEDVLGREIYDDRKITLGQMEKAADYILGRRRDDEEIRLAVDNTFARAAYYLIERVHGVPACYIKTSSFHPTGGQDYFIIYRRSVNEEMPESISEKFSIRDQVKFGNLLVIDAAARNINQESVESEACYKF